MPEYRHHRSGSLNIASQNGNPNGNINPMAGGQRFEGPRSPPSESTRLLASQLRCVLWTASSRGAPPHFALGRFCGPVLSRRAPPGG